MNSQALILLHGWGKCKSARSYYHETVKAFQEKGYNVYVPDMPGFGEAKVPKYPHTLHDYTEFIHNFIKQKDIRSPILIGHSFGGRAVIKYVSSYDTDVKAIVLCGTPGYTPVKKVKLIASLMLAKIGGLVFSLPGLSTIAEKIRGWFYYVIGARDYYRAEGAMRQTFKNIIREELKNLMRHIHIPTLLVWGEEDIIVPIRIAERMEKTIVNSKLIILPHGKHSVIIDDPKSFVNEVHSFLKSL